MFSLSALQLANTVLPLVTVPYIVRVIGPKDYGTIAFAQAFTQYFVLLITYGFDFTASREIAQNRANMDKVREIFWTVIWSRMFLFVVSTIAFLATLLWVPQVRDNFNVMVISYLFVIGTVTFPTWFFQGIERLGLTTIFNFIVKIITTAGVFVFLQREERFLVIPLLLTIGQVVAGGASLAYASTKIVGWLKPPPFREVLHQLKTGFTIFVSTVFISFYTVSNTVILAFFASQESVGFFAGGTKVVTAVRSLALIPLTQSMFPHIGKMMKEDQDRGILVLRKMTLAMFVTLLPASLGLLIFAGPIVHIVLGKEFGPAIDVIRITSFFPLIIGIGNVFGIQGMLNLKQDKTFLKIIAVGSVLDLLLNCLLDMPMKASGAAMSWLITEIYITLAFFIALRKANVNLVDITFFRQWLFEGIENSDV